MKDIVNDLWSARLHDPDPWDVTLYGRAADEISRLRFLITQWADACEDVWLASDPHDLPDPYALDRAVDALRDVINR